MLFTNITALLANVGAQTADILCRITATRHGRGGQPTDGSAVHVCANTFCHPRHIRF